jgi:hypothetical protein
MPKKAYLANHFNSHALKQKYLKSQDSVESRRWGVLWKVSLGWTIKKSALALGCEYSWQRPRPKHRACEEKSQQEFKENLPRKVKQLQ